VPWCLFSEILFNSRSIDEILEKYSVFLWFSVNKKLGMLQIKTRHNFKPLTEREQWLTGQMVNIAISVHKILGPGLLESIYEKCFCYELAKKNIPFVRKQALPIIHNNLSMDEGFRINLVIEDLIIIELKAQENYHPLWEAQLLSCLKLTGKRLGYIMNFHVPLMKDGIKRMIL
jgi:GxxExxY protein